MGPLSITFARSAALEKNIEHTFQLAKACYEYSLGDSSIHTLLHNDIHALRQEFFSHISHDLENFTIGNVH